MSEVEVGRAAPADWQDVKQTRLRALADAPYAFASTLAREQGYRDEEWRRRVTNGVWFLARTRGRCVGIAATYAEQGRPRDQPPRCHVGGRGAPWRGGRSPARGNRARVVP